MSREVLGGAGGAAAGSRRAPSDALVVRADLDADLDAGLDADGDPGTRAGARTDVPPSVPLPRTEPRRQPLRLDDLRRRAPALRRWAPVAGAAALALAVGLTAGAWRAESDARAAARGSASLIGSMEAQGEDDGAVLAQLQLVNAGAVALRVEEVRLGGDVTWWPGVPDAVHDDDDPGAAPTTDELRSSEADAGRLDEVVRTAMRTGLPVEVEPSGAVLGPGERDWVVLRVRPDCEGPSLREAAVAVVQPLDDRGRPDGDPVPVPVRAAQPWGLGVTWVQEQACSPQVLGGGGPAVDVRFDERGALLMGVRGTDVAADLQLLAQGLAGVRVGEAGGGRVAEASVGPGERLEWVVPVEVLDCAAARASLVPVDGRPLVSVLWTPSEEGGSRLAGGWTEVDASWTHQQTFAAAAATAVATSC